jgi:hypothetical protein
VSLPTVYRLIGNRTTIEALQLGENGSIRIRRSVIDRLRTSDERRET